MSTTTQCSSNKERGSGSGKRSSERSPAHESSSNSRRRRTGKSIDCKILEEMDRQTLILQAAFGHNNMNYRSILDPTTASILEMFDEDNKLIRMILEAEASTSRLSRKSRDQHYETTMRNAGINYRSIVDPMTASLLEMLDEDNELIRMMIEADSSTSRKSRKRKDQDYGTTMRNTGNALNKKAAEGRR